MSQIHLPEPFSIGAFAPARFEAAHEINLETGSCRFRTIAEDCVFTAPDGAREASIFSISYVGTGERRPVMFIWNGGPGSATSMLHLECFGPWQIARDENGAKQYGLVEDPSCLLDVCDLVFVDPVGVGYSRLLDPTKAGKYDCVDGDARSVAFFMTEWLRRHDRWDSPVYVCGESYGTVRACRVLAELGRSPYSESRMVLGIPVAGVILVGLATEEDSDDPIVYMMPAMAATNWYHHQKGKGKQDDFVHDAWEFARMRLLPALFDGAFCPDAERRDVAERLQYYTGVSADYFIKSNLKIGSPREFLTRCVPGDLLDLYDTRMKKPISDVTGDLDDGNVPIKVMNSLLAKKLNVDMPRLYYTGNININIRFNWTTEEVDPAFKKTHLGCLRAAMKSNRDMRVLFASGLYDACTHAGLTRHAVSHADLPMERVTMREYKGGHGVYSSPAGKAAFLADVRKMIANR